MPKYASQYWQSYCNINQLPVPKSEVSVYVMDGKSDETRMSA